MLMPCALGGWEWVLLCAESPCVVLWVRFPFFFNVGFGGDGRGPGWMGFWEVLSMEIVRCADGLGVLMFAFALWAC
jgi:hypothetical protein